MTVSLTQKHKVKQQMLMQKLHQSYPKDLAKLINKHCYTKQQIFNKDEIVLCWKKISSRIFTVREKLMPGFKGQAKLSR